MASVTGVPDVPRWLARLWLVAGAAGVVLGLAGGVLGATILGSLGRATADSLDLTLEVLDTVDATTVAVEGAIDELAAGLRTGQQATADAAITLTQVSAATSDVADLLAVDLPESLEAIEDALPPVVAGVRAVDGTLRALSLVGVDYDPEVPLDQAVDELETRLAELPPELRGQAVVVEDIAAGLSDLGTDALTLAEDQARLRARLLEAGDALGATRRSASQAEEVVAGLRQDLRRQVVLGQAVAVGLGLVVAAGQTLPLIVGWWLLRGSPSIPGGSPRQAS